MSAVEAKEFGLIDEVLVKAKDVEGKKEGEGLLVVKQ
jgi:ATP-dependent protease ClpP protease subunit